MVKLTRRKPTPAEAALPEKCCFWCHHVKGIWRKNYAPDHFTKSSEYDRVCRYTPLIIRKNSHTCEKWITCDFFYHPKKYKFDYPFVVTLGLVDYAFHTQEEYQAQHKIWLEGLI